MTRDSLQIQQGIVHGEHNRWKLGKQASRDRTNMIQTTAIKPVNIHDRWRTKKLAGAIWNNRFLVNSNSESRRASYRVGSVHDSKCSSHAGCHLPRTKRANDYSADKGLPVILTSIRDLVICTSIESRDLPIPSSLYDAISIKEQGPTDCRPTYTHWRLQVFWMPNATDPL